MALHQLPMHLLTMSNPKFILYSLSNSPHAFPRRRRLVVLAATKNDFPRMKTTVPGDHRKSKDGILDNRNATAEAGEGFDFGWRPSFPHVLAASMSNFLFGYHIGNSAAIPDEFQLLTFFMDFVEPHFVLLFERVMNGPIVSIARELGFDGNSIMEGLVVSIFIAGAFIGSLASAYLVDKFGCRRTLQIDSVPLIIGAILSAQAHSVEDVLWGRFLVGLGIGVNTVLVPIYISEVSPTKYRGSLGSVCQLGTCLGIIVSLFISIPSEHDPHWWRMMLYIATLPGFLLSLGMQFAVESPRWLCKAGRLDEARTILNNLWGSSEVDKAIVEFQSTIKHGQDHLDSKWSEILEEPHSKAAFIGGALFFLQQFAGINGVLYFSSLTFQDVGIKSASLATLYIGLTNFAGALTSLYLIDKQGRRKLLIGSYLGMAIAMFIAVYSMSFLLDDELRGNVTVFGTLMYIYTFALGAGPVTGLIIPELSSTRLRGKIMSLSFSVHWVCNFVIGLFFLELVGKFGVAPVYASFGVVSLVSAAFAYSMVIETKGRSLEEIELSLRSEPISGDKR